MKLYQHIHWTLICVIWKWIRSNSVMIENLKGFPITIDCFWSSIYFTIIQRSIQYISVANLYEGQYLWKRGKLKYFVEILFDISSIEKFEWLLNYIQGYVRRILYNDFYLILHHIPQLKKQKKHQYERRDVNSNLRPSDPMSKLKDIGCMTLQFIINDQMCSLLWNTMGKDKLEFELICDYNCFSYSFIEDFIAIEIESSWS